MTAMRKLEIRDCKAATRAVTTSVREILGARVKSYGNIWVEAVAHIAATSTDARGLLYITNTGELLICQNDNDAPTTARYVAKIGPETEPLFVAARLQHVARYL